MIKEKAKELSDILLAYSQGRIIQMRSFFGPWYDVVGFQMEYVNSELRIKPEPKLVSFTFEDNKLFRDKWIILKNEFGGMGWLNKIVNINNDGVKIISKNGGMTDKLYCEILEQYIFEDGSPCGKYIE